MIKAMFQNGDSSWPVSQLEVRRVIKMLLKNNACDDSKDGTVRGETADSELSLKAT